MMKRRRAADRPWLMALAVFAILFLIVYPFCLSAPYHADTAAYMLTVRHFLENHELEIFYPTRPFAGIVLIPLATWLGDKTLAATMALGFAATGVLGMLLFSALCRVGSSTSSCDARVKTPAGLRHGLSGQGSFSGFAEAPSAS